MLVFGFLPIVGQLTVFYHTPPDLTTRKPPRHPTFRPISLLRASAAPIPNQYSRENERDQEMDNWEE